MPVCRAKLGTASAGDVPASSAIAMMALMTQRRELTSNASVDMGRFSLESSSIVLLLA
jgi:hypothetical protein